MRIELRLEQCWFAIHLRLFYLINENKKKIQETSKSVQETKTQQQQKITHDLVLFLYVISLNGQTISFNTI